MFLPILLSIALLQEPGIICVWGCGIRYYLCARLWSSPGAICHAWVCSGIYPAVIEFGEPLCPLGPGLNSESSFFCFLQKARVWGSPQSWFSASHCLKTLHWECTMGRRVPVKTQRWEFPSNDITGHMSVALLVSSPFCFFFILFLLL